MMTATPHSQNFGHYGFWGYGHYPLLDMAGRKPIITRWVKHEQLEVDWIKKN